MNMTETCGYFADLARNKAQSTARAPAGVFVASMMAGAYVGIALILALTCSAGLPAGVRPLVSGAVFGIGLILVVLAGAEMFTGHVMYETFGLAGKSIRMVDLVRMFVIVWLGNLAGSVVLAWLFVTGGGVVFTSGSFLHDYILHKETSPFWALFARAILCNWLVCLAIWLAARLKGETAKMVGIAWCLLAFVACGFEHSVANMTAVSLGLLAPERIGGMGLAAYNLSVVSFGNFIGGALFVTGAYLWAARAERASGAPQASSGTTANNRNRPPGCDEPGGRPIMR